MGGALKAAGAGAINPNLGIASGISTMAGQPNPLGNVGKALGASLGPMVGASGGASGTGYAKPEAATITPGATQAQIEKSYTGNQNSLLAQQQLLTALQGQQGLQQQSGVLSKQQGLMNDLGANNGAANQGSVFNQAQGLGNMLGAYDAAATQQRAVYQQQNLNNSLAGGVGVQNSAIQGLQGVAGQQQGLANQYGDVAAGRGPNPAQAMLNQQTGNNIASQAALMAGQRGAGANVGLMARQIGQQGAGIQQQAVGQGAVMQANQSLNAMGALGQQQQAMAGTQGQIGALGSTQAGMQQSGITAQGALAGQQIGQQQNQQAMLANVAQNQVGNQLAAQQAVAGQANQMAAQQIGQVNTNAQAQQSEQQILQNALQGANQSNVAMQGNINSANAGLAGTTIEGQKSLIGGAMNGIGAAIGAAEGGEIVKPNATQKFLGSWDKGGASANPNQTFNMAGNNPSNQALQEGATNLGAGIGKAMSSPTGQTPASPDNAYSVPKSSFGRFLQGAPKTMAAANGGMARKNLTGGGNVIASSSKEKATKSGNSYDNDKIPAMLSEGEVVIPRSVMQSKDPVRSAGEFVAAVMAKRGRK